MLSTQPTGRLPRKWSLAEDQKLREEVEAQLSEGEVKDWCRIASALPGRTNKDCRKRWHNSVAGGLKKGQWSRSEDAQLARGVQQFGQRWTLVSNTVQSRSADQCAKRWQQSLDPELDRSEWRDSEDKVLIEAVQKLGRHWKDIQRQHFRGRSKNSIKNRYTVLLRRYQNQGVVLPFSAVTPEPTSPNRHSAGLDTDDDDGFLSSQGPTQVSTPEIQQSWPTNDESFANWPSGDSFNFASDPSSFAPESSNFIQEPSSFAPESSNFVQEPSSFAPEPLNFSHIQQYQQSHINANANNAQQYQQPHMDTNINDAQWNWPPTSMPIPQITYQQPLLNQNPFTDPLSPFAQVSPSSFSSVPTNLGSTAPRFMSNTNRRSFPGSPAMLPRTSARPSSEVYENSAAMAQMIWDAGYRMQSGSPPYGYEH